MQFDGVQRNAVICIGRMKAAKSTRCQAWAGEIGQRLEKLAQRRRQPCFSIQHSYRLDIWEEGLVLLS